MCYVLTMTNTANDGWKLVRHKRYTHAEWRDSLSPAEQSRFDALCEKLRHPPESKLTVVDRVKSFPAGDLPIAELIADLQAIQAQYPDAFIPSNEDFVVYAAEREETDEEALWREAWCLVKYSESDVSKPAEAL